VEIVELLVESVKGQRWREDRDDLRQFLMDFEHLMLELTTRPHILTCSLPNAEASLDEPSRDLPRSSTRHASKSVILSLRPHLLCLAGCLSLADADLMGASRERKVSGFRRALQRFRARSSRRTLGRVFRWANMILGSRATVIPPRYHLKLWMGFPDESAAYLPA